MHDRETIVQAIYATFAAPYGPYITPSLRQQLRICAGQAADRVLSKIDAKPTRPRSDTMLERNQRIAEAYTAGASLRELAEEYGMSFQRVQQILARLGVAMRPKAKVSLEIEPDAILAAYKAGTRIHDIATQAGFSASKIREVLERNGVDLRPKRRLFASADERDQWIAESYADGATLMELSTVLNMSHTTIGRIIREQGGEVRDRGNRVDQERDQECAEMYAAGMTYTEIGDTLNISPAAVGLALNRMGIEARGRGKGRHASDKLEVRDMPEPKATDARVREIAAKPMTERPALKDRLRTVRAGREGEVA